MKKKESTENPTPRWVHIATALFLALCAVAAILAVGGLLGL